MANSLSGIIIRYVTVKLSECLGKVFGLKGWQQKVINDFQENDGFI